MKNLKRSRLRFFGSLGAASKKIDEATGQSTIKAITRENPIMGFVADLFDEAPGARWAAKRPRQPRTRV